VALGIGYCGLDARRAPLNGDEVRPCWEPIRLVPAAAIGDDAPISDVPAPEAIVRPEVDGLGGVGGISPARR